MNSSNPTHKRQNILIISQDEETVKIWANFFKQKEFHVTIENDAKKGLQTSRVLTPSLIILDLNLNQSDQIKLCQDLRSTTNGALLLLAPQNRAREIPEYHQAGVDEFISTPTNSMAVLMKSITWLARQDWIVPRKDVVQLYM